MVYINGIPIAVIECKSPTAHTAWDKAYSDLFFYQANSEKLFWHNQLCIGLWQVGARYGAIGATKQFFSVFKTSKDDDLSFLGTNPSEQDKLIYSLFRKDKIVDIIRHFVLFELDEGRTVKKLPRFQQYRATNKTVTKLKTSKGGVVWHTQGSGKSLTMAYVARKLQAPEYRFDNPTIIIMTDRQELDRQITTTLQNTGFKNVRQASSVAHLDTLLRNDYGGIITTTLQKFQENEGETGDINDETALEERRNIRVKKSIKDRVLTKITEQLVDGEWVVIDTIQVELQEISEKKNLYVMVDEAHRSHYGFLAAFMRSVLPHAKFIAFTGTPISKEEKSTLGEFYGGDYIDVYTIKESVPDGATVELRYDEGIAKLDVKKEELDAEFNEKFGHYSKEKQDRLKQEALRKYQFSVERITAICRHLIDHYREKIFPDGHKAMIVCDGRDATLKYANALEDLRNKGFHDFKSKVVISIGSPKTDPIAKTFYGTLDWNKKHPDNKKPVAIVPPEEVRETTNTFKLPFGNKDETEKSGKKKHDNTAFLIVSDMLLTGYDIPIASCLYLDKPLKEHNLLQAIARVNRSGKGKKAGYIMDYIGITENLLEALKIYSGDLDRDDIMKNINDEIPKLELNHTRLVDFFRPTRIDRIYNRDGYIDAAMRYIEPVDLRDEFKLLLSNFNRSINIVLPDQKALEYVSDFKLYNEIKFRARNAFPEDEDLRISREESKMLQDMIDKHLTSQGVENLLEEPISIYDTERFSEELKKSSPATRELKMRNNLKYTIKVGLDKNPEFYKPLAERLEQLIKMKEEERISHLDLFKEYEKIEAEILAERKEGESKGFTTERQLAVYATLKKIYLITDEDNQVAANATTSLFKRIAGELDIVGWNEKAVVLNDIENKVMKFLKDKMDRKEAKEKARELVEILKKNKDA